MATETASLSFRSHALSFSPMHMHCTSTSKLKQICRYMKISPIRVCTCRLHESILFWLHARPNLCGNCNTTSYWNTCPTSLQHMYPAFFYVTFADMHRTPFSHLFSFTDRSTLRWLLNKEVQVLSDKVSARLKVVGRVSWRTGLLLQFGKTLLLFSGEGF